MDFGSVNQLMKVEKPSRYIGGELNSVTKDKSSVAVRFVLAFPDTYEIGMSFLGFKILYHVLNLREDTWAERTYAPWTDMADVMRKEGMPLHALESGDGLADFDFVGFTLQYEMSYTNILYMLDLAGIPARAADRGEDSPIVIGGGPCAYNSEPVADFFDLIVIGEAEDAINVLLDLYKECKQKGVTKAGFLARANELPYVYVPALQKADKLVTKALIKDLDGVAYPEAFLVPFAEAVHSRAVIELFRGCSRGCRFCQAGMTYRPVREKSEETLLAQAEKIIDATGYDEIGVISLSSADYSRIDSTIEALLAKFSSCGVGISMPSLRIDAFSVGLAEKVQSVRKSGLTFAPEAGSQRMRDAINKNITEEDIFATVDAAIRAGWKNFKLYFMIGLPGEDDSDVVAIADLASRIAEYRVDGKGVNRLTVSVSNFVPKAFTPFQWDAFDDAEELRRKHYLIKHSFRSRKISFSYHDEKLSFLEAIFARGDRSLSAVIEAAYANGCFFDGWGDKFKFDKWLEAFEQCGIDPEEYAYRKFDFLDDLPWDHISCGVDKAFLRAEKKLADELLPTPDCRTAECSACGVCTNLAASNIIADREGNQR